jgi:hypothetical protein
VKQAENRYRVLRHTGRRSGYTDAIVPVSMQGRSMSSQYVTFAIVPAVAVLVGLVLALVGFRKLGPRPGSRETSDRWHARYGRYLRLVAGLCVIGALVYFIVVPLPATWTRHTTADGACSAEFPEVPRHEVQTRDDITTDTLETEFKDRNSYLALSFRH